MGGFLERAWGAVVRRRRPEPPDLSRLRPVEPTGRVVVSALGPRGVSAWKTDPEFFYPPFAFELSLNGIELVFALESGELERACDTQLDLAVIHVYNEDFEEFDEVLAFDLRHPRALVFNRGEIGRMLGWKDRTHQHLTGRGISMPGLAGGLCPEAEIFSNERRNSKARVFLLRAGDGPDPGRYNTEFIDTRWRCGGTEYHTSVRLLCVGPEIVHAIVRATDEAQSVNARARMTPLDPEFRRRLYDELVVRRRPALIDLARRLHAALGPGFYAHDLLVERGTGRILVCESGFKFDDFEHRRHWRAMAAYIPERDLIFGELQPALSARAFLAECRRHGRFAAGPGFAPPFAPGGAWGDSGCSGTDAACERATA